MTGLRLGIDLGGTKIEIAALDADGDFALRERVPTPQGDYAATLRAIAGLVAQAEQRLGVTALPLGIGIPGSLSPLTGRVRNANSTALNGQPLQQDLEKLLNRPVRLENDANCLALSEATDGAGAGADVVFAAILGTGVGAGVAVHGRVLLGCNGVAGEWGHNPLPRADAGEERRQREAGDGDRFEESVGHVQAPVLSDHAEARRGRRDAEGLRLRCSRPPDRDRIGEKGRAGERAGAAPKFALPRMSHQTATARQNQNPRFAIANASRSSRPQSVPATRLRTSSRSWSTSPVLTSPKPRPAPLEMFTLRNSPAHA